MELTGEAGPPGTAPSGLDWELVSLRQYLVQNATYGIVTAGRFQRVGIPMVRGGDIRDGSIGGGQPLISYAKSEEYSRTVLREGDVVIALVGYPGEAAVIPLQLAGANISRAVGLLRPARTLLPEFLAHYLNSPAGRKEFLRPSAGSAQVVVNLKALNELRLPLPPLREQRAISAALHDVATSLRGAERLIAKKRDLKQAAMQQLLAGLVRLPGFSREWECTSLGELGRVFGGLSGKTKADFGQGTGRYVAFTDVMTNVVVRKREFDRVRVASTESQTRLRKGDLLFNGSSETPEEVAMCALLGCDVDELFLNSFCFGLRLHDPSKVSALFLAYYFRSEVGRAVVRSLAQGSTRYNISKTALLNAQLRLPSLDEQVAIATALSDMDDELAALEARREKTKALKQAMMQELLTGRTRLVAPEPTHA